jgi:hypothetical protein
VRSQWAIETIRISRRIKGTFLKVKRLSLLIQRWFHYFGSLLQESDDVNLTKQPSLPPCREKLLGLLLCCTWQRNCFPAYPSQGMEQRAFSLVKWRAEVIFSEPEPVVEELKETLVRGISESSYQTSEDASLKLSSLSFSNEKSWLAQVRSMELSVRKERNKKNGNAEFFVKLFRTTLWPRRHINVVFSILICDFDGWNN